MGMWDEIWWEPDLPIGHPPDRRMFQTKSFDSCFDRYVVTKEGRLFLVGSGWKDDGDFHGQRSHTSIDVEFHGDITIWPLKGQAEEYTVRFTNGTLEWIRPKSDLPQIRRNLHPPDPDPQE